MKIVNEEFEINLNNLFDELKKHIKIFLFIGVLTAAGIFVFNSFVIKPVYQYNLLLRISPGVDATQMNNCVEIIKNNVGTNSISNVELIRGTSIIKIIFQNKNKDLILDDVEKIKPLIKDKVSEVLTDINKQKHSNELIKNVATDILQINSKLNNYNNENINLEAVKTDFKLLSEKIYLFEKRISEVDFDFVNEENNNLNVLYPNTKKDILIGETVILFFASSIVVCKYLIKNIKK